MQRTAWESLLIVTSLECSAAIWLSGRWRARRIPSMELPERAMVTIALYESLLTGSFRVFRALKSSCSLLIKLPGAVG